MNGANDNAVGDAHMMMINFKHTLPLSSMSSGNTWAHCAELTQPRPYPGRGEGGCMCSMSPVRLPFSPATQHPEPHRHCLPWDQQGQTQVPFSMYLVTTAIVGLLAHPWGSTTWSLHSLSPPCLALLFSLAALNTYTLYLVLMHLIIPHFCFVHCCFSIT